MVSSFTTNKGFDKPANGDYVDTWNIPVNADWDIADRAFGGTFSISLTNVNVTLTKANCQNVRVLLTGSLSGNVTIFFPSGVSGFYIVTDATTGAYTVTLASAGGSPGLFVTTIQGQNTFIFSDGANVFYGDDMRLSVNAGTGISVTGVGTPTISLITPVSVANGGTGVSGFTANSLLVGNGTSPLVTIAPGTGGNVLTSTGTSWASLPPSGSGGGITSISFQTGTAMGLSFTPALVNSSGQTVVLDGVLALTKGGTGTSSLASGIIKSNGSSLSGGGLVNLASEVTGTLPQANGGTGTLGGGVGTALANTISTGSGYFILNSNATLTSPTISSPSITSGGSLSGTFSGSPTFSGSCSFSSNITVTNTVYFTNTSRYWTDNNSSLNLYYNGNTLSANNTQFYLFSGVIPYAQQTNFTLISDRRTKTNIKPYEKSLSAILSLRPVTFQYNGEYGTKDDGIERVGLIAQDVEASQMPELVSPYEYEDEKSGEKTEIYTVNPSDLIFTMMNAIAELEARVKTLEAKLVS
jgi:hypothetical protein